MTTLLRNGETLKIENNKVELYVNCGWKVIEDLFTFDNKKEQNENWISVFGD